MAKYKCECGNEVKAPGMPPPKCGRCGKSGKFAKMDESPATSAVPPPVGQRQSVSSGARQFRCTKCEKIAMGMPPTTCPACQAKDAYKPVANAGAAITPSPPSLPPQPASAVPKPQSSLPQVPQPTLPQSLQKKPTSTKAPLEMPGMSKLRPSKPDEITAPPKPPTPNPPIVTRPPDRSPIDPIEKSPAPAKATGGAAVSVTIAPIAPQPRGDSSRLVWSYPAQPNGEVFPQRNSAALYAQSRFCLCASNQLIAFADRDGQFEQLWHYDTGGSIPGSPVIGPDGNIRVHSGDEQFHIVTPDGARFCNPAHVGEPLCWAAPIVDKDNNSWICGYHGGLLKVDAQGQPSLSPFFRGKQRFDSTGLIHEGMLYVGAENACVYAIDLTGTRGKNLWDHLAERGRTGWFINSALALAKGPTLVVASRDDRLYGFQLDGRQAWSVEMEGHMLGSPIIHSDGTIYVGLCVAQGRERPRGALVRVDGISHKIRWRYETPAPVESTPAIDKNGVAYCGDNDGTVYAVSPEGKAVWKEQLAAAVRSPGTWLASGRVIFGLDNGQFVALRCDLPKASSGSPSQDPARAVSAGVVN